MPLARPHSITVPQQARKETPRVLRVGGSTLLSRASPPSRHSVRTSSHRSSPTRPVEPPWLVPGCRAEPCAPTISDWTNAWPRVGVNRSLPEGAPPMAPATAGMSAITDRKVKTATADTTARQRWFFQNIGSPPTATQMTLSVPPATGVPAGTDAQSHIGWAFTGISGRPRTVEPECAVSG
jgi:hypothetical protein